MVGFFPCFDKGKTHQEIASTKPAIDVRTVIWGCIHVQYFRPPPVACAVALPYSADYPPAFRLPLGIKRHAGGSPLPNPTLQELKQPHNTTPGPTPDSTIHHAFLAQADSYFPVTYTAALYIEHNRTWTA